MTKPTTNTINAMRTLFGARAATRVLATAGGSAAHVLEESGSRYGAGWDAIRAVQVLSEEAMKEMARPVSLNSPQAVRNHLRAALANKGHEVFAVLFLDAQHRVITYEEMFRGTLTQTSVYPREVVKQALRHNSAAVILAHNHPSGIAEPSRADEALTRALKEALALIDVRVLDHIVVARADSISFAERGLI
jgi:DNA repair protein RadC